MCLIKGAFVGEKNFDVIKMHGTTIKISTCISFHCLTNYPNNANTCCFHYSVESFILSVNTHIINKESSGRGRDTAHSSRTL